MDAKPTRTLVLIFLFFLSKCNGNEAKGFSVDLIHRDFLPSPSRNLSDPFECVRSALLRSHGRVRADAPDIVPDEGAYVMKFSVGTPPFETAAIADTGSDLTWIQCQPCIQCFRQDAPIFEPRRSSSYTAVSCSSDTCASANSRPSCNPDNTCGYTVRYGDRSYSRGDVVTEKVTMGKTSIKNVVIGCSRMAQGTFGRGTSGIVGLGGGKVSLISQLGSFIKHKFSYCLIPLFRETGKSSSKLHFGQNAVVMGAGMVSTPIVFKSPKTFYYLTLEGITVGNQRLDLLSSNGAYAFPGTNEGNIIIDSGTTLTYLPTELYAQVRRAVKSQVKLQEIRDPAGLLDLCFRSDGGDEAVPGMTVHFRGADVELKPINTFLKTSGLSICLAFAEASSLGVAIYGNIAQGNFLVGYDLVKKRVSFKPMDCAGK